MTTYKIVRMYESDEWPNEVIETGLTLEEAQEHCRNDQTHSKTCTSAAGIIRTKVCGKWFDGYSED